MLCLKLVGSVCIPESGSGAKQSSEGKRRQKKRQSERQSGVSGTSYFLDSCTMSTSPDLFPAPKMEAEDEAGQTLIDSGSALCMSEYI